MDERSMPSSSTWKKLVRSVAVMSARKVRMMRSWSRLATSLSASSISAMSRASASARPATSPGAKRVSNSETSSRVMPTLAITTSSMYFWLNDDPICRM